MSHEANKAIVIRFLDGINQGNFAVIEELVSQAFREIPLWFDPERATTTSAEGRGAVHQDMELFAAAFPDMHATIDELIAEDDRVVVRFTTRGTHTGTFKGVAPTGRAIQWTEVGIVHIVAGHIAAFTTLWDRLGFLQQLGILPGEEQILADFSAAPDV
jgi:steroid delta-isomerase-like uncharacterized protein